jgi:hypothetical protein
MVIVTVALVPAFVICPFLTAAHRQQVTGLLAGLRQWTAALTGPGEPHPGDQGPPQRAGSSNSGRSHFRRARSPW